MSLLLFYQVETGIKVVSDNALGVDFSSVGKVNVVVGTDSGTSSEAGAVVIGGITPQVGLLPAISLEVGFDAAAGLSYAGSAIGFDPIVYYKLSDPVGALTARDEAGNLEPTITGATKQQASLLSGDTGNKSFSFDGNDFLLAPTTTLLDTDTLTVSAIIKPSSVTGTQYLVYRQVDAPGIDWLMWAFSLFNGYLEFAMRTVAEEYISYRGTYLHSVDTEYHVAVTVREGAVELFTNGELTDFWPKSWTQLKKSLYPPVNPDDPPVAPLYTELVVGYGYNGVMDEVSVYLKALQKEDIKYLSYARAIPVSFTWTEVSGDIVSTSRLYEFSTQRGRQDELREAETGVFNGVLRNQDRRFDPANPSSPYDPDLKPVKPIWLHGSITSEGIARTFSLFRGDTENWPQDWKGRVNDVPLVGLDGFDVLSQATVNVSAPVEKTGARIHRILDAAMWPADMRVIEEGRNYVQAWTEEVEKARELLNRITKAESGYLFVDGFGRVVFRQRNTSTSAVKAIFSNVPTGEELPFVSAKVIKDKEWVKNDIRIQVTNGPLYVAQDPQSIKDYRIRTLEMELPLVDDGIAGQVMADWLLSLYKDSVERIREVVLEPQMDDRLWKYVFDLDIGDRVRFKVYPPGGGSVIDLQSTIEYVAHKYIVGRWTTTWIMSPADTSGYWLLGDMPEVSDESKLDETTKLAY